MILKINELQEIRPQQEAEIFVGKDGLRAAYERLFHGATKKDEDLFFYIHEEDYGKEGDLFYFSVQDLLKKVKMRGICNEKSHNSKFIKKAKFIDTKFSSFPIPGNIEVCRDDLLIVSWERPIIGVLVHSKSIVNNFRRYFESVWRIAKKM